VYDTRLTLHNAKNHHAKRCRILLATLCVLSVLSALTPAEGQGSFESPQVRRFGAVEAFSAPDQATIAGVRWERVVFWWYELQPQGPHEWNIYYFPDGVLNAEMDSDREIVGMIAGTPAWASVSGSKRGVPRGLYLPLDDGGNLWANFIRSMVSRYRGRIDHWVIWNEPDVWDRNHDGYTWEGTETDYYRLLKVAYLAAKEVNPDCVIHFAGLTYWWDAEYGRPLYFRRVLDVMEQDPTAREHEGYFDVVTLHLYFDPDRVYDVTREFRQIMGEYGMDKPIWVNETNAAPCDDATTPIQGMPRFPVTMAQQAEFIVQAFAMGLAGGAERISIYKMIDEATIRPGYEKYGWIRSDGSPRPALHAYRTATTHMADAQDAALYRLGPARQVVIRRGMLTTRVFWNDSFRPVTVTVPALASQAVRVDVYGHGEALLAQEGKYVLNLAPSNSIPAGGDPTDPLIGGGTVLLVEEALPPEGLEPWVEPAPMATPTSVPTSTATPTTSPSPTATLTPAPAFTLPPVVEQRRVEGEMKSTPAEEVAASQPVFSTLTLVGIMALVWGLIGISLGLVAWLLIGGQGSGRDGIR